MKNWVKHTFFLGTLMLLAMPSHLWGAGKTTSPKKSHPQKTGANSKKMEAAPKQDQSWLILVEGQRRQNRVRVSHPSSFSILSKYSIEKDTRSLTEILRDVAGLEMRSSGGPGAFSTLSLRGSSSEQVAVYLDGLPLNQALGGGVNLGDLSLKNLERIEIYKSFIPPQFSDAPIGGVVHLISRRPKARQNPTLKLNAQVGSFGHQKSSLEASQSGANYRLRLFTETEQYKGDFSYLDNGGTPFNSLDDVTRTRLNSAISAREFLVNGTQDLSPKTFLSFSLHKKEKDQGVPGFGVAQSLQANLATEQERLQATLSRVKAFHKADVTVTVQRSRQLSAFRDHASEIGLGPQDNKNRTLLHRFQAGFQAMPLGRNKTLEAWLTVSQETWRPHDRLSPFTLGRPSHRGRQELSVGYEQKLSSKFKAHLVSRFNRHQDRLRPDPTSFASTRLNKSIKETELTHDASLVFSPKENESLRLALGTGQRLPNLFEIFGDRGSTIGNSNLFPENSFKSELGWRREWKKFSLDAVAFQQDTKNLIVFEQTGQFVSRASNLNKTQTRGQEITLDFSPNPRWTIGLSHTRQKVAQRGFGAIGPLAPGVPKSLNTFKLEWAPLPKWELAYQLHRRGPLPQDSANFVVLPSQTRHSLRLSHQWKNMNFHLGVENLLDRRLQDIQGFPLPGRAWTISLDHLF